jgi:hypothetical protein
MANKPTADEIERDVIYHVQHETRYHAQLKEPYCVDYSGKVFASTDTRDLVIQITRECYGITLQN